MHSGSSLTSENPAFSISIGIAALIIEGRPLYDDEYGSDSADSIQRRRTEHHFPSSAQKCYRTHLESSQNLLGMCCCCFLFHYSVDLSNFWIIYRYFLNAEHSIIALSIENSSIVFCSMCIMNLLWSYILIWKWTCFLLIFRFQCDENKPTTVCI